MFKEEKVVQEVWTDGEIRGYKFRYRIVPQHIILDFNGTEIPFEMYDEMERYIIAYLER